MRRAVLAAIVIMIFGLAGCGGDDGYEGFGHKQGSGLNSPYDTNDASYDQDKFTVRPFNVSDGGFTTRPFRIGAETDHRTLSFTPVDRKSVGSLLVYVVDRKDRLTDFRHDEDHAVQALVPGRGSYQVKVSYPDADSASKDWKVEVQRVEEVDRKVVRQPASWTKTSKSDGVTSVWDSSSKVLDTNKFSTTPVRVGRHGYTSLPMPVGDITVDGNSGANIPMSFIPTGRPRTGTLLVVVSDEPEVYPEDYAPEGSDGVPEDSAVGFSVKTGVYQVDVSYRDQVKPGWTVVLQKVTRVPLR